MKTVIIVQARMGSTRLPGKVLKELLGRPLLSYLFERLKRTNLADLIIVATTTNSVDDPIVALCKDESIPVFRGSEDDVLDRYLNAAKEFEADTIVRITADCPLIDPAVIDECIHEFQTQQADYLSNTLKSRTFPRGMDVEVFSRQALITAAQNAKDPAEREHVTLHLYRHPDSFRLGEVHHKEDLSDYRLTVDTEEDFQLIEQIFSTLYPENPTFTLSDLISCMEKNPDWIKINAHIKQKKV